MRLMKLFAYCAFGYLVYEFWQGLMRGPARSPQASGTGSRDLRRALNQDPGRMNVTGPARGTTVSIEEPSGARANRVVGRGVVPT